MFLILMPLTVVPLLKHIFFSTQQFFFSFGPCLTQNKAEVNPGAEKQNANLSKKKNKK